MNKLIIIWVFPRLFSFLFFPNFGISIFGIILKEEFQSEHVLIKRAALNIIMLCLLIKFLS
jgi:hypothetical protein